MEFKDQAVTGQNEQLYLLHCKTRQDVAVLVGFLQH